MGGVGAIVCGCCSSGRVLGDARGTGNRGLSADVRRRACVPFSAARCIGRRAVLGVVLCWASCCVGRRVVLGVV